MSDKEFYQTIADELRTKTVDAALWMKAKATADGDPDKTEAAYIKLRFSDLKKSTTSVPQTLSLAQNGRPNLPIETNDVELSRMRNDLAKKLLTQGKKSLYSTLKIHPDAGDSIIAAAIADLESQNLNVLGISPAEFKYAKDTLSNHDLREQYDRQLLASLSNVPKPYSSYAMNESDTEYSWWESRKTSVIVGVLSITILGYLGLNYLRERHTNNIQKEVVDITKDAVHGVTDTEQLKTQADIDLKERSLNLAEERQKQELELRARLADQMADQQRANQEARMAADQQRQELELKRQQAQKDQADNLRIQRQKQYYECLNQQLDQKLLNRYPGNYDPTTRCAIYR